MLSRCRNSRRRHNLYWRTTSRHGRTDHLTVIGRWWGHIGGSRREGVVLHVVVNWTRRWQHLQIFCQFKSETQLCQFSLQIEINPENSKTTIQIIGRRTRNSDTKWYSLSSILANTVWRACFLPLLSAVTCQCFKNLEGRGVRSILF